MFASSIWSEQSTPNFHTTTNMGNTKCAESGLSRWEAGEIPLNSSLKLIQALRARSAKCMINHLGYQKTWSPFMLVSESNFDWPKIDTSASNSNLAILKNCDSISYFSVVKLEKHWQQKSAINALLQKGHNPEFRLSFAYICKSMLSLKNLCLSSQSACIADWPLMLGDMSGVPS